MLRAGMLLALAMTVVACADAGQTGDSCTSPDDCEDSQCITGGSFPGGTCTPACDRTADCPSGFSCISRSSGICLRNCANDAECEDRRGASWQCREESLEEGGGNAMVCIGD